MPRGTVLRLGFNNVTMPRFHIRHARTQRDQRKRRHKFRPFGSLPVFGELPVAAGLPAAMRRTFLAAETEHRQSDIGICHSPDQAPRVNELTIDRRIGITKREPQVTCQYLLAFWDAQ